jgi:uncharacterized protein (TIGR03067 family)
VLLLAAVAALHAQDKNDKNAKAAELEKLQGTWKVTSAEFSGKAMTPKEIGIDTIVVKDAKMTLRNGDKEVAVYPFELLPDRKPKGMIWTKEGPKGGKLPAIYELDGTKLKLCFPLLKSTPLKEFPKLENFDTKGKPLGLLIAEKK